MNISIYINIYRHSYVSLAIAIHLSTNNGGQSRQMCLSRTHPCGCFTIKRRFNSLSEFIGLLQMAAGTLGQPWRTGER